MAGRKYGRLLVLGKRFAPDLEFRGRRVKMLTCLCDCGKYVSSWPGQLRQGHKKSCGCLKKIPNKKSEPDGRHTHGMSMTPEYVVWYSMVRRCTVPEMKQWMDYGGRGIKVCERWADPVLGVKNFYEDMGPRPHGCSLDRIDVNGNYEPSNCRWATYADQASNQRKRLRLEEWSMEELRGEIARREQIGIK